MVKVLVDFGCDGFTRQAIKVFWNLIKVFPFFNRVAILGLAIVPLLDLLEIFYEVAEIFIVVIIDLFLYLLSDILRCFGILLFPHISILLH